jgi:hypothetical protein
MGKGKSQVPTLGTKEIHNLSILFHFPTIFVIMTYEKKIVVPNISKQGLQSLLTGVWF